MFQQSTNGYSNVYGKVNDLDLSMKDYYAQKIGRPGFT